MLQRLEFHRISIHLTTTLRKKEVNKKFHVKNVSYKNKSLEGMMIPGGNPINEI